MNINTNIWNKIRYTLYTPGYNLIARRFNRSRKKSIDSLNIRTEDKILIVGAGTGLDLEFLPADCEITATDITPSMVGRIRKNNKTLHINVQALVMDGHCLEFPENSFDVVILHLILAVIPDPVKCLKEVVRVLKPGGQVAVYDKFLPENRKVSIQRRLANILTNILITDITRTFESIVDNSGLTVVSNDSADFNGNFRLIQLIKK
jgi:phosphatidylethanolamine/phosphatidyl-N-methylethanolamine N-methyltransferase